MPEEFPGVIPGEGNDWPSDQQSAQVPEHESLFIRESAETADMPAQTYEELPETQAMGRLFEYIDGARRKAFASFVTAVNDAEIGQHANPTVTMYTAITSEQGILTFRHSLDAHDFAPTLAYAGLHYKTTGLLPELVIDDGQRFGKALTSIQVATPTIRQGVENTVSNSLRNIAAGFVPGVDEESYWTFHADPLPLPRLSDSVVAKPYEAQKQQLFNHAHTIAANMALLDMDPYLYDELLAARDADTQGALGEWAVANHWGLYQPPTVHDRDRQWTMWRSEKEWQPFFDFIDHVVEKAGADSPFVQHLAARTAENITSKRLGIVAPPLPNPTDIPGIAAFTIVEETPRDSETPLGIDLDNLARQLHYDGQLLMAKNRLHRLVH